MSHVTIEFADVASGELRAGRLAGGALSRGLGRLVRFIGVGRLVTLAAVAALVSGVAIWDPPLPRFPSPSEAVQPAPKAELPAWVPVSRPIAMFALDTPLLPREPRTLETRRHVAGGGREEVQSFGSPGSDQPFARIIAYRTGAEAAQPGTLFLDTARRAAEAGYSVTRSAAPVDMVTKFGVAETTDVILAHGGDQRACIAWRILTDEADLRLSGWLCGAQGRPADRITLSCALDRLDLVGSGDDKALKSYFSKAERGRLPQCMTRGGARRAGWLDLDPEAAPPLRSQT